jgi:hypothetical protein
MKAARPYLSHATARITGFAAMLITPEKETKIDHKTNNFCPKSVSLIRQEVITIPPDKNKAIRPVEPCYSSRVYAGRYQVALLVEDAATAAHP